MMTKLKWDEFPVVSPKQWKQKIQADLKGKNYNETLIWKTEEGIDVKPFYTQEDINTSHAVSTHNSGWKIGQHIRVEHLQEACEEAHNAIACGTECISFIVVSEKIALEALLKELPLERISIYFEPAFLSVRAIKNLNTLIAEKNTKIYLDTDIIGNLVRTGNWFFSVGKDYEYLESILNKAENFKTAIAVDMALYQNAGATMVQQLAYGLAQANEYCNVISRSKNISTRIKDTLQIQFKTAAGSNYFFEIAKLRALRILWATLASEYNIPENCHIIATPTTRNKTIYDYNVNMLRTTTEYMSAILGGADTIFGLPYDAVYHKENKFGTRIARNQMLILKNESYFDKLHNPAEGTYYIEYITTQLAEKALELFKQIEAGGGFLQQLKAHHIQKKIKAAAMIQQEQFDRGEKILVGTNMFPDKKDKIKPHLERDPFMKVNARKTLIEPVIPRRIAENIEKKRLDSE